MDGFGERLKRLRKERDITQGQLAAEIGVVASAVGKYERIPQSYPSVEVLIKIADFFQVSTDYLLNGTQEHGSTPPLSPENRELLHIYESLHGSDRLKLLHYAVELEQKTNESTEKT